LQDSGLGGKERLRREKIWNQTNDVKKVNKGFPPHWGKADVRGTLYAMHGRACAYCQRNLPGSDRGDVEHFRPKETYWWLAYEFVNYLLSCTVCNSSLKGRKFPLLNQATSVDYGNRNRIDSENRALIDPSVDEVSGWMTVDFDAEQVKKGGFKIRPSRNLGNTEEKRCTETIDLFELDRDTELLRERQIAIHSAMRELEAAEAGNAASADELKKSASSYQPHAFAIRELLETHARRPKYLPSDKQEVEWLVDEFIELLGYALNTLRKYPSNNRAKTRKERYCWALAVLMKEPPALTSAEIRKRIDDAGYLGEVRSYYDKL
jgi:uncharacterized protein (TIGR02646 family)